jgi:hypothetical protein
MFGFTTLSDVDWVAAQDPLLIQQLAQTLVQMIALRLPGTSFHALIKINK